MERSGSGAVPAIVTRLRRIALFVILIAQAAGITFAADPASGTPTPIKAPECIGDPSALFFSQNVPLPPVHPVMPIGHYYQIVRYMGIDATAYPTASDYGSLPADYAWPPYRGLPLTGFTAPSPRNDYQRTSRVNANADNASAFQLSCYDAGSYINTWTFPDMPVSGGGAHSIYGYSFDPSMLPFVYDSHAGTDFALQASVEIPWFNPAADPNAPPGVVPVGQVNLFAYFLDSKSGKAFGLILAIFDNRYAAPGAAYAPLVAHDGQTPFVSSPIGAVSRYATPSPYSWSFTGNTWTGLRFYRAHITQDNFRAMLADINAYCAANTQLRLCSGAPAFSTDVADYVLTDFGELHEVFRQSAMGNLSMGVHVYGLGAWNFR